MIRPVFTRRFWTNGTTSTAGYDSRKYASHELSDRSAPQSQSTSYRLGFRKVKDPYGMSVLETKANESEEKIIKKDSETTVPKPALERSSTRYTTAQSTPKDAINVTQEVNVSSTYRDQTQRPDWEFV